MKLFRLVVASVVVGVLSTVQPVAAATFDELNVSLKVKVADDMSQRVSYDVSADQSDGAGQTTLPILGQELTDVVVAVNGTAVTNFTTALASREVGPLIINYTELTFATPATDWSADISYQTHDLMDQGQLRTFAVPVLPLDATSLTEAVSVSLPLDMGLPVALGEQASSSDVGDGRQSYEFQFSNPRTKGIILDFSTEQEYGLKWQQTFSNTSFWWKTFEMVLAPDSNQQAIQLESISPTPSALRLDRDGNIIAQFRIRPRGDINVEASARATVRSIRYAIDQERTVEEVPDTLETYLAQTGLWSNGTSAGGDTAAERLELLLDQATADVPNQSAATYLDFMNEFVADARASGLPARLISGRLTHNGAHHLPDGAQHYWAEVYLPGTGWMTVDPVLDTMYDQFAHADAFRIAEFIRGVDSAEPKANPQAVQFTKASAITESNNQFSPAISQTKYLLVPGLSFVKTVVTMPAGRVVDGLGYSSQDKTYRLGSLAPLQTVQYWTVATGGNSWSGSEAGVGFLSTDGVDVIATNTSNLSYAMIAGLVAVAIAGLVVVRKYRRKRNQPIRLDEADEDINIPAEDLLRPASENAEDS